MSNVQKFNENLFTEWSLMTFSDYEKEYSKKFKRTSKNIKKYYEMYVELYNSSSEELSDEETDNEHQKAKSFDISLGTKSHGEPTNAVDVKVVSKLSPSPSVIVKSNVINSVNQGCAVASFLGEYGGIKIRFRESDGYICATDMQKAAEFVGTKRKNTKFCIYSGNNDTKLFFKELSSEVKILTSELYTGIRGNGSITWCHRRVATDYARWLSPKLAVKMNSWCDRIITGDVSIMKEVVDRHDNINKTETLVSITSVLKTDDGSYKEELATLHETLAFEQAENKRKEIENRKIIKYKDEQIDRMEKLLKENKIDFDKLFNLAEETKQIVTEQKQIVTEQKQIATRTLGELSGVKSTLDRTEQKLTSVETTLDRTEQKLDKAVSSVIERKNNRKYDNYLCVYKLREPACFKNIDYKYYVTRSKTKLKRDKYKKYILDSKYEKVICEIKLNHSVNSWYIIKDKLEKERKVYGYRNYFFIYENNGISVISERELEQTFNSTITTNKNRIKQ